MARDFGITGAGIDMSQLFSGQAKRRAQELGVAGRVRFIHDAATGLVMSQRIRSMLPPVLG